MRAKSTSIRILTAAIFIFTAFYSTAQAQNGLLNRLKLSVNTGINFASANSRMEFPVMGSELNAVTQQTYVYGGGIQFAIDPAWSVELGYKYSNVLEESDNFETTMHTASLKNFFNLEQLFVPGAKAPILNPYLSAGVGYDIFSYKSSSVTIDDQSISYNAGLGLAVRVIRNVELFSHYEYHFASNLIDNLDNVSFEPDILNTVTGGIRINFSSGNKSRKRSAPPINRQPNPYQNTQTPAAEKKEKEKVEKPVEEPQVTTTEPDAASESITRRVKELEKSLNQLKQKVDNPESGTSSRELYRLAQRVENMEMTLQEVQTKLSEVPDNLVVEDNSGIATSIPLGNYVQVFASNKLTSAQKIRKDVIGTLDSRLEDTSKKVFITRRDKFYQVLIGEFSNMNKASNIKEIISGTYSDAFIINFPRPLSLQPAYENMEMIKR